MQLKCLNTMYTLRCVTECVCVCPLFACVPVHVINSQFLPRSGVTHLRSRAPPKLTLSTIASGSTAWETASVTSLCFLTASSCQHRGSRNTRLDSNHFLIIKFSSRLKSIWFVLSLSVWVLQHVFWKSAPYRRTRGGGGRGGETAFLCGSCSHL